MLCSHHCWRHGPRSPARSPARSSITVFKAAHLKPAVMRTALYGAARHSAGVAVGLAVGKRLATLLLKRW